MSGFAEAKEIMNKKKLQKAFIDTIPVLTGYIVLGIGFGLVLNAKGYGVIWAFIMSTWIYAGSMQYLAVDLMAGGASLVTTVLTTLMVNARHLFYGISMIDRYKDTGKKKPYIIYALTDETYSLVCTENAGEDFGDRSDYYFLVSLMNQTYWVLGSVIGNVIGATVNINTEGVDFALTALFVTVFVEQWLSTKDHRSAVIGVVSSVACLLIFGSGNFLIPAMLVITGALTVLKMIDEQKKGGRQNG